MKKFTKSILIMTILSFICSTGLFANPRPSSPKPAPRPNNAAPAPKPKQPKRRPAPRPAPPRSHRRSAEVYVTPADILLPFIGAAIIIDALSDLEEEIDEDYEWYDDCHCKGDELEITVNPLHVYGGISIDIDL